MKLVYYAAVNATEFFIADAGREALLVPRADFRKSQRLLAPRLLALSGRQYGIGYEDSGKPFALDHSEHLSISHSGSLIANSFSTTPAGTDLELIGPKARKVAKKFMSPDELSRFGSDHLATLAWTIKEALFKMTGKKPLNFSRDLFIESIDLADRRAYAIVKPGNIKVELAFLFFRGYVACWTLS